MCKSVREDLEAKPVGCTPSAENFGAFQPNISRHTLLERTSVIKDNGEEGEFVMLGHPVRC